jgi:hypothetical protein
VFAAADRRMLALISISSIDQPPMTNIMLSHDTSKPFRPISAIRAMAVALSIGLMSLLAGCLGGGGDSPPP